MNRSAVLLAAIGLTGVLLSGCELLFRLGYTAIEKGNEAAERERITASYRDDPSLGPKSSEVVSSGPTAGMGRIILFRSQSHVHDDVHPEILVNDHKVGKSVPGGYFFVDLAPGVQEIKTAEHTVLVKGNPKGQGCPMTMDWKHSHSVVYFFTLMLVDISPEHCRDQWKKVSGSLKMDLLAGQTVYVRTVPYPLDGISPALADAPDASKEIGKLRYLGARR
jgi:hypothetical protein